LFEDGFEIFDDLLGQHVGMGEIVGLLEAFISGIEDIQAGFVTVDRSAYSYERRSNVKRLPTPL
jgi:hypothetical protein